MLSALTYTTIRLVFPQELWSRAMALNSAMWGIATLSGPAIGGVFAELGVWRLAFGSIVPLVLGLGILLERILPRTGASEERHESRVPWLQLGVLAISVLIVSAASAQDTALVTIIGIAVAISLVFVLVRIEKRTSNRLLPTGTFSVKSPIGPIFGTMVLMSFATTADIFIPLFLQDLHGLSPLWAGYLTAVMSIGWTLASLPVSGLAGRPAAIAIVVGQAMMVAGLVTLAITMPAPGESVGRIVVIAVGLTLLGMGMGSGWAHVLTRALAAAPEGEHAITAQSLTTVQMLASAFGAAFAGVVTNLAGLTDASNTDGTANAALWLFSIYAVMPLLAMITFLYSVRQSQPKAAMTSENAVRKAPSL
jgi:MFS family permease